ncbi:MAG TPA: nickel-responsive transcriptional regulator NikR [Eggerthellaceae bacterium]|nr:nickel-responsive transcriptional regulator NikR [Eggerthellaceae bacterium]
MTRGQCDGGDLTRFSVAMPEGLLMRFDSLVARRGIAKNRSEVIRDLVRDALVQDEVAQAGTEVMGTLTIVYDHHAGDVQETLHSIQHAHFGMIVSTTHVHVDEDICLEVIILRGETTDVHLVSDMIVGTKGVKHGGLVVTTIGQVF